MIKLTKEQSDLLKTGTIVRVKSNKENSVYYFLPFWFRCDPGENEKMEYEQISLEKLPEGLSDYLEFLKTK